MTLAALGFCGYALWCLLLYMRQDAMFFPGRSLPGKTPRPPRSLTSSWIEHPDGVRTEYWVSSGSKRSRTLLYLHGNGERIEHQAALLRFAERLDCAVVLPEYRGYGSSEGNPSQASVTSDLVRIVDELRRGGIASHGEMVYWGRSLGAGFAAQLALERSPAAMILQTPFARTDTQALRFLAPPFLVRHPFRTDRALPRVDAPVLVLQHSRDALAPVKDSERLAKLHPRATLVSIDAQHNDTGTDQESRRQQVAIQGFLEEVWAPH